MDYGESSYRRFLNGDDQGMVELIELYKDSLTLYLNTFVSNIFIAEELTEDTFFRLMVKKPRFYGKSSFKTWLYAIGRNIAVDYVRRNAKLLKAPIEDLENYISEEQSIEQAYIQEEQKRSLHKALSQLNPDYRSILWLVYFEDLTPREAAIALKKSARQVKNLLYRARQALKSKLELEERICEE